MSGIFCNICIFYPFFVQYCEYGKKKTTPHTELSDIYMTFYTGIFNQTEEFIDKHSLKF